MPNHCDICLKPITRVVYYSHPKPDEGVRIQYVGTEPSFYYCGACLSAAASVALDTGVETERVARAMWAEIARGRTQ